MIATAEPYVHLLWLENPDPRGEDLLLQIRHARPIRSAVQVLRRSSFYHQCREWKLVSFVVGEQRDPRCPPRVIHGHAPRRLSAFA